MDLQGLKDLVSRGEGNYVEFKRKASDPVKIMREVVAFANHKGGFLLIGVDDDGAIPGLKHAEDEEFILNETLLKHCRPAVEFTLERIRLSEKRKVLVYKIKEAKQKPMFLLYNLQKKRGRAYIRVEDKSVQASRELRKILKLQHAPTDTHIKYGENERAVIRCFKTAQQHSFNNLMTMSGLPEETVSGVVVKLTLANILKLHPMDGGDHYSMIDHGNT